MNSITFTMYVIYTILGEDVFNIIKKKNELNITLDDISSDRLPPDNNSLSVNQRIALFGYIFLYIELSQPPNKENILLKLTSILSLPYSLRETCSSIINKERIDYITQDFNNSSLNYEDIFYNTSEYISDMITGITLIPLKTDKIILNKLSAPEYEHPTDKIALEKLRLNPALEKVLKVCSEYDIERIIKIQYTGSCVQVTEQNIPYLYNAVKKACEILDIEDIPPIYLEQGFINAHTIGMQKPIITISNACLSLLTYDELLFLIGHELGHIKSQHLLYHTLGDFLPYIGEFIGNFTFGIGNLVSSGLHIALLNWHRMSEFSADRAGLLVCQNPDAAISLMAKLAGFPVKFYSSLDIDSFLHQAQDFEDLDSSTYNKLMKFFSTIYNTHPWTVMRAKELKNWIDDGSYDNIFNRQTSLLPRFAQNTQQGTNFCPMCGGSVAIDSHFCSSCGASLDK